MNLRMPLMPVAVQLEGPPRLDNCEIVARPAHKLQPDREIFLRESTRNGHCREPADITDAREGIGKSQIGLEIQCQRCRWNRLRCCCDDVKYLKQGIHFFLNDFSYL